MSTLDKYDDSPVMPEIVELFKYEAMTGITFRATTVDRTGFLRDQVEFKETEAHRPRTHTKKCFSCSQDNLHWEQYGEKWKLVNDEGFIHSCKRT